MRIPLNPPGGKLPAARSLIDIFECMYLIRTTEEAIAERYAEGKMRCPTHLSTGQECPAAVMSVLLEHEHDQAVSTHRAHAHYLAKGGDPGKLIAELYGKATGCSGGYGGSMHLIDQACGFMGSTAIVGGSIPVGVGLALAKKIRAEPGLVVVYLGDAAVEEGSFYESANFAALHNLPLCFFCENNGYSVYSPLDKRQPGGRRIHEMVRAIGIPAWSGNGNDVLETCCICNEAITRLREQGGPIFVELHTWRWREHCGPECDDHLAYRPCDANRMWRSRDPLVWLERHLLQRKHVTQEQLTANKRSIDERVQHAFTFAEASTFPDTKLAESRVFA